jgi:filamentous hemagglutinin family protein
MFHQPFSADYASSTHKRPVTWSPALRPAMLSLALAAAFSAQPVNGQTLPAGGVASHGQAAFSSPSPQQLVVTTQNGPGSGHSAINWQSFSISAGSSARITQPDAASLSINRVVTNNPSAIFGSLSSNGRLVLVNPSGITVGAGAVIDTAGFTASALRMTDANALAGRLRFGDAAGITVEGRITARDGDIVLVAPQIAVGSSALLQAANGSTILAAGQQVEITGRGLEGISLLVQARDNEARNLGRLEGDAVAMFAGTLRHRGTIQATTATREGGKVVLQASGDATVEATGTILATGQRGGQIDVLGQRVGITDQALIDASGTTAGGSIRIGGDFQGRNAAVPNADKTFVGQNTVLRADARQSGNGGRVIVWSDDQTQAYGSISARGGNQGGDGGFAEVSGKKQLDFQT